MKEVRPSNSDADRPGVMLHSAGANEANTSGVSWSAVWAGGFVTAALSLILLALGAGLGFASVSAWSGSGLSASKVGLAAILWFIAIQFISSSMGGYLAGRLRTKWTGIHTDEVFFRDTAHGFLAWSVALVITAAFLTSAATSLIGSASSAKNVTPQNEAQPNAYFVDSLFRGEDAKAEVNDAKAGREAAAIFAFALQRGDMPDDDRKYLDQVVMAKSGISQGDADKRVSEAFMGAQAAADAARKALAHTLLWTFIALLIGAFCASFAGTIGGRQRDHVVTL
jgi:hypothetical protein